MQSAWFQSSISQLHLIHHLTLVPHLTAPFDHSTLWEGIRKRTNKKCMQVENPRDTWCGDGGVPKSEFTEWNSPEPVKHCIIMFKWQ